MPDLFCLLALWYYSRPRPSKFSDICTRSFALMGHRRPVLFKFGFLRYGLWFLRYLFSYCNLESYTYMHCGSRHVHGREFCVRQRRRRWRCCRRANGQTDRETDPFCVYRRADVCRNGEHAHKGEDSGRQGTIKGLYGGHVPGRTSVARATRFARGGGDVHTPHPPGRQRPLRKRKGNPFFLFYSRVRY